MRYAWMNAALAVVAAGMTAGCVNFGEESASEPAATDRAIPNPAQRETARVVRAFQEKAPNPLNVEEKFRETAAAMRNGAFDFSRGEFFSGMTDEALLRQAMLTWDLTPLFKKMRDGSCVMVVTATRDDRILRQALTSLLAANSAKATVIECAQLELAGLYRGAGAKPVSADYLLKARPVAQKLLRSWSLNKYQLPCLRRYAAASVWLELYDLRESRVVWSGTVDSSQNYVGDYTPLLWLYETQKREIGAMAIPPAMAAVTAPAREGGDPFTPANEILIGDAFRQISLPGAVLSGLAAQGKSLVVWVEKDTPGPGWNYADAIRSLLLEHGVKVRYSFDDDGFDWPGIGAITDSWEKPDYALLCRVDYAGATALPDAPGSDTFRRRAAVLLWAELVELPSGKIVWCGQLTGESEVQSEPLIFYPVIFRDLFPAEPRKSSPKDASDSVNGSGF